MPSKSLRFLRALRSKNLFLFPLESTILSLKISSADNYFIMNSQVTFKIIIFSILISCLPSSSSAEDSYKWKDKSGRIVYGNKAPSGAENLDIFKTRGLSKYSATRALKNSGISEEELKRQEELKILSEDNNKDKSEVKSETKTEQIRNNKSGDIKNAEEVILTAEEPRVTLNEEREVREVKVLVKNDSPKDAFEVSVAFSFPKGKLIPAKGPFEIASGTSAEFSIPEELLPIPIDELIEIEGELKPKVILHSLGVQTVN